MDNTQLLIYWIEERYKIYLQKEAGLPKPWSNDPVFQETYFCNVHRENDKVTKWIRQNYNHSHMNMPEFNMIVARLVNKPSSLRDMHWPFDDWSELEYNIFKDVMGQKGSWGSAYIVSTNGRSMPKHEYIAELLTAASNALPGLAYGVTCQSYFKALQGITGLASFMSAQVVADLKNTPMHPLKTASDWWTFVAPGPGSLRGMAWIENENEPKVSPARFHQLMPWLRDYVDTMLHAEVPRFSNQDLQNCLCEFDKYCRVFYKTGRSKRRYNGTSS